MAKINSAYKEKLEKIFKNQGYILRYEKGNFRSGWCVLEENEVIVINKFLPLESKVSALQDIIRQVDIDEALLNEKDAKLVSEIKQTEIKF